MITAADAISVHGHITRFLLFTVAELLAKHDMLLEHGSLRVRDLLDVAHLEQTGGAPTLRRVTLLGALVPHVDLHAPPYIDPP